MKIEIELQELNGVGCLHQEGFTLEDEAGNPCFVWAVTVPGCLPYIRVEKGKFAGKTFTTGPQAMMDAVAQTFFAATVVNVEEIEDAERRSADTAAPGETAA